MSKAYTWDKIAWVKSALGKIDHTFTNCRPITPISSHPTIKVIMRGYPKDHEYNIKCSLHVKAGQIASKIMMRMTEKYRFSLEEYVLVA